VNPDLVGAYTERAFPRIRYSTIDTVDWGRRKHHLPILLEVDVTRARSLIQARKAATGEGWSFAGWVACCIGRAASEHKQVHAMRKGSRRLILFDDVDITIPVERQIRSDPSAVETLPMPLVIRSVNRKSVDEVHREIRAAQAAAVPDGETQIGAERNPSATRVFFYLPKFLRGLLVWNRLTRDPFFAKRSMGTVALTSLGSPGTTGGWGIPVGIHPLVIALGNTARKPGVVGDRIEIREYLSLTVLFDHDVIDGAPMSRFVRRLQELLEAGHGLSEPTP
jgi:hypothetical protein